MDGVGDERGSMSQQSVIEELQRLGMSGYEAKAYVALVAAGIPLNGYEVAKRSGVPRSTVYETLGKLVGRGAAYEVRAGEASVGYISLPPIALLDRMRREFEHSIESLRSALPEVASPPQVRLVHNLLDRPSLLARAEDVVVAARTSCSSPAGRTRSPSSSLWSAGGRRGRRRVRGVVRGGSRARRHDHRAPVLLPEVVLENLGCRLLVVSADREQAVIGGFVNGDAWGVYPTTRP